MEVLNSELDLLLKLLKRNLSKIELVQTQLDQREDIQLAQSEPLQIDHIPLLQVKLNAVLKSPIRLLALKLGKLGCVGVWNDELRKDYQQYEQQEQTNHCYFVEVFVLLIREDEIPRLWVAVPHYNYYNFIMSESREFRG